MESNFDLYNPAMLTRENVTLSMDVDDLFFLKSMQHRIIEVSCVIDDTIAQLIQRSILQINQEDKGVPIEEREPIKILITSDGGDTFSGLAIIDAIQNSKTPVWTINVGREYSMAAIIGVAGHKRYATKNASFLIHDGAVSIQDSGGKVNDFIKFNLSVDTRIKNIVISNTNITSQKYNARARNEWYFFADEAKKLGMIDGIIGEDIDLDEII